MRFRTSLVFVAVASLAVALPQTLQFARTYVMGDADSYHLQMKMEGQMALEIGMDLDQKVTKVYGNGDADIETKISGGKMTMMGNNIPIPSGQSSVARMTRYGGIVSGGATTHSVMGMDFAKYARQLPKDGLAVGQSYNIDEKATDGQKVNIKGSSKLESIQDGVSKLHTVMDLTAEDAKAPMHMDFVTLIDTASSKMKHMEGKVTNLSGVPSSSSGMKIDSVSIVMDRKEG